MTELLIVLLGCALVGVAVYLLIRASARTEPAAQTDASLTATDDRIDVMLPLNDVDPNNPATRRLVDDAARRALAAHPGITLVVVLSRGGSELGRVQRTLHQTPRPYVDVPLALAEPHTARHHAPDLAEDHPHASPHVHFTEDRAVPHLTLADHFELPDGVRARITNPEDAVDLVRAILDAGGVRVHVDGNVIRIDDRVLIVLRTPLWAGVNSESLNRAFLRFQRSGARTGVVVTPGTLYSHDVRRRESLAPQLLHAGPDGIQRMADAVAMGADPLDFVVHTWAIAPDAPRAS